MAKVNLRHETGAFLFARRVTKREALAQLRRATVNLDAAPSTGWRGFAKFGPHGERFYAIEQTETLEAFADRVGTKERA